MVARRLYTWEIDVIYPVFGSSLYYALIRVHENTPWPDRIDHLGRRIKGMPSIDQGKHNAITIGNHCMFPVQLPKLQPEPDDPNFYLLDWLVHELTHTWQYQHMGWAYLIKALLAQFRDKGQVYEYGGAAGLVKSLQKGIRFEQFNPEQQGRIVQDYFLRKTEQMDVVAWEPYIQEIKSH